MDDMPLEWVSIYIRDKENEWRKVKETYPDGYFSFNLAEEGKYDLIALSTTYGMSSIASFHIDPGKPVKLPAIHLGGGISVKGKIRDPNKDPIPYLRLMLFHDSLIEASLDELACFAERYFEKINDGTIDLSDFDGLMCAETVTDSNGRYAFSGLKTDHYFLIDRFFLENNVQGYEPDRIMVDVHYDGNKDLTMNIYRMKVSLIDDHGKPIQDANLYSYGGISTKQRVFGGETTVRVAMGKNELVAKTRDGRRLKKEINISSSDYYTSTEMHFDVNPLTEIVKCAIQYKQKYPKADLGDLEIHFIGPNSGLTRISVPNALIDDNFKFTVTKPRDVSDMLVIFKNSNKRLLPFWKNRIRSGKKSIQILPEEGGELILNLKECPSNISRIELHKRIGEKTRVTYAQYDFNLQSFVKDYSIFRLKNLPVPVFEPGDYILECVFDDKTRVQKRLKIKTNEITLFELVTD
jgi:hypothetical protein